MIKSYSEFINEDFSQTDKVLIKTLMAETLYNIDAHGYVPEFCETRQEGETFYIRVSAKKDVILNECKKDVTVMVLPSSYKPNALMSLESGSYSKDTTLDKFEIIKDEGASQMFRNLYDDVCKEYGKLNMIMITLMY